MWKSIASAKVNLSLNVTGRRADGFHLLSSVVAFTFFGDEIVVEPGEKSVVFSGKFASKLDPYNNSALDALHFMEKRLGKALHYHVKINKKIPVEAGLGGGTADAAEVIRAICAFEDCALPMPDEVSMLGADVPVSMTAQPQIMTGIGEILTPIELIEMPITLINPLRALSTKDVFGRYDLDYTPPTSLELKAMHNDLQKPAIELEPSIGKIINYAEQFGIARMSGSGSTVFVLAHAKEALRQKFSDAWIVETWLKPSDAPHSQKVQ